MNRKSTALVVAFLFCFGAVALADATVTENFDQTYTIAPNGRVSLANVNGDVTVAVWDQPTVRVQAVKEADSTEDLQNLRIEVSSSPSSLDIETKYPQTINRHNHLSVQYTLTVPKGASLDKISLVNGGLTAAGVGGKVRAKLVNGEARLTGLSGSVSVDAVNGEISVELTALDPSQEIELKTVNGPIDLRLPASAGARLHATTVNGRLSNDFGVPVNKHQYVGADMTGAIGAGGADVELETVNGRVNVAKM